MKKKTEEKPAEKRPVGRPKGGEKYGGKEKGTPTYKTANLRNMLRLFQNSNYEKAVKEWEKIDDPAQKFRLYLESLKYTMGTVSSVDVSVDVEKTSLEQRVREAMEKTIKRDLEDGDNA